MPERVSGHQVADPPAVPSQGRREVSARLRHHPAGRTASPLLEVTVTSSRDAAAATQGGADRLHLVVDHSDDDELGLSPEPALVSAVCRESDLPVRVMVRLTPSLTTTGAELARMAALVAEYRAVGAEGLVFGFLDADLEIDLAVCARLAEACDGAPWTFHRGFDQALATDRAWRHVLLLPSLDAVATGGSVRGLAAGVDELVERAERDPRVASLAMAAGGLLPEHVPWLVRAGVRRFAVGTQVRPGGTWARATTDAAHVRSWRMLVDDAADRAAGVVPG